MTRKFLRTREAAAYIGASPRTLEDLRIRGGGPAYSTPRPRFVVYAIDDLERWVAAGRRSSTSDPSDTPGADAA